MPLKPGTNKRHFWHSNRSTYPKCQLMCFIPWLWDCKYHMYSILYLSWTSDNKPIAELKNFDFPPTSNIWTSLWETSSDPNLKLVNRHTSLTVQADPCQSILWENAWWGKVKANEPPTILPTYSFYRVYLSVSQISALPQRAPGRLDK